MKAVFYVFSGTGNTKRICKLFAEELSKYNCNCDLYDITASGTDVPSPNNYDRVCIAYPVHGFNAPEIVMRFAEKLPASSQAVYYLKTSGEPLKLNSASSCKLIKCLAAKGYQAGAEFHYVMPYNMIFRHSDAMVAKMWEAAKNGVPSDAAVMARGERLPINPSAPYKLVSAVVAVEHPAMHLIGRGFKVDEDKCLKCGKCVKNCPQNNISVKDGKITFGKDCIGCVRCSFNCPTAAIRIGLLNGWRVNGAYDFDTKATGEVCRYCKKSYTAYFKNKNSLSALQKDEAYARIK